GCQGNRHRFFTELSGDFLFSGLTWQSKYFSHARVTPERAVEIVQHLFARPEVESEIMSHVRSIGGDNLTNPKLWDFYFKAYDNWVTFSDGYLYLIVRA